MKKNTFMKFIAIICILTSVLLVVCSCKQEPQNNQESNTTPAQTTNPVTDPITEPVTEPVTEPAFTGVIYKVTVVDENNAPLAGAMIQLCNDGLCGMPGFTDANGVATFEYDEPDNYTVKVTLTGYTGEAEYTFPADSTELTVQLTASAADPQ